MYFGSLHLPLWQVQGYNFACIFLWAWYFCGGKIGIVFPIGMARVSCPSVSSGSLGISYPWFVPVYPTAIACGFGELITLVGPFSPYSHCFGVCFAQEETCVMRPWHHQAANSRVFFNAHKCKVPSFMLVKTIRMSFVPMMKPRVYSLFCIVVAYFFIPSCRIIPCLILSSLPLSQLSGHLLCSPISSP